MNYIKSFFEFITLTEPNVRYVVVGTLIISVSSAVVGVFTFLKKKALVGDAVAHSILPGICVAFLLTGVKNPILLTLGAFISGWVSLLLIDFVVANSKIKTDTAIGIIFSVFFGVGILLLTIIQHTGNAAQSGLESFLFGKAAALVGSDLWTFAIIGVMIILCVSFFYKELQLISFDVNFAKSIGYPVRKLEIFLTTLTVLAVTVGIQAVGVTLMAAMLITPVAAARCWTNQLWWLILLSALFGAFAGITGAFVSYTTPSMPTGPCIVIVISFIAFFSFLFSPNQGIIYKKWKNYLCRIKMMEENILKALYMLGEKNQDFFRYYTKDEIMKQRTFERISLQQALSKLTDLGYLQHDIHSWRFTPEGKEKGLRIAKLHRLWEVYLAEHLKIAPDHVHEDAEAIEHIITPEIEKALEEKLNYPTYDPHQSRIPYR
jgi:manganese/zinc/iron transport system permease protein